ncbi:beta-1,4-mannosyltransferase-like protein [Phlyctochytrium arcticum]|nr:beta-1,4-mannosyltransferase-like protein [Phlyctochytrium arcticum]
MAIASAALYCASLFILIAALPVLYLRLSRTHNKHKRVLVLVLGDLGRSPRTQYHAISLAHEGYDVHAVGYGGSKLLPQLAEYQKEGKVTVHYIKSPTKLPSSGSRFVYLVRAIWRTLFQFLNLLWLLTVDIPPCGHILVQNPPAVPTLLIAQIVRLVVGTRLIIDWHNYGYSIMALNLGNESRIVEAAFRYELAFGRHAEAHVCVSHAMARQLVKDWEVKGPIVTMHDRAPAHFRKATMEEIHHLFTKYDFAGPEAIYLGEDPKYFDNIVTTISPTGVIRYKGPRPKIIVSSTSWTEDEEFDLLLDALRMYEKEETQRRDLSGIMDEHAAGSSPRVLVIITGQGPLKEMYKKKIRKINWRSVEIKTVWLEAADYPTLLGAADLGISLHVSSSGVDLPMKIVDMFGCELPVCAVGYGCLKELVEDGVNGRVFVTASELFQQLTVHFPIFASELLNDDNQLQRLREGTQKFRRETWQQQWEKHVKPVFIDWRGRH